jgi:hypothetical protein
MSGALRFSVAGALGLLLLTALHGCVVGGGGYYQGGDAEVTYGADFYEPFGYEYGGWGPGYFVGPPRDAEHHHGHGHFGGSSPYRPAEPSRSMPSIPTRSRRR